MARITLRLAVALGCAVALCAGAMPAAAQLRRAHDAGTPAKKPHVPNLADPVTHSRVFTAEFAGCMLDSELKQVVRILSMPEGPDYRRALLKAAPRDCIVDGNAKFPFAVMRGALFVELYRRYSRWGRRIAIPGIDFSDAAQVSTPDQRTALALLAFGDCVVKRDPAAARDVVLAETASTQQEKAYRALIPNLGPCLAQGQQLTFSKPVIEGVLAEVMYRGVISPVPSAAGTH